MTRILIILGLLAAIQNTAFGCTCNIRPPACYEYWRDDFIFIGTIAKSSSYSTSPSGNVEITVDENFRGMSHPMAHTFNYGHSCAFDFKEGQRFLFYGKSADGGPNFFGTSFCMRTAEYSKSLVDVEFLRAVQSSKPVFWAWGTISEWGYDVPLPGVRAEVLSQGKKIEGVSNSDGDIRLEVSKPGTYRIRIYLPKGRTDINALGRNDQKLWEMQRQQIVGGRFRGSRPYVDYQVSVEPNRCGWFDVSIPREK